MGRSRAQAARPSIDAKPIIVKNFMGLILIAVRGVPIHPVDYGGILAEDRGDRHKLLTPDR